MASSSSSKSHIMRKVFACELRHVVWNDSKNCYELKIKGSTFDVRLIWLQGYLSQNEDDILKPDVASLLGDDNPCDIWLFRDQSASDIPVLIPDMLRRTIKKPINDRSYYSVVTSICPPEAGQNGKVGNVKLKARRLIDLNAKMDGEVARKHNQMAEEVWALEVIQYHRMVGVPGYSDL